VILALSGNAAFLGQSDEKAFIAIQAMVNAHGGIKGHPVKFVIQDSASNPATSLQLVSDDLSKNPPVIIGPGFTPECLAVAPIMKNGPVDYCLSPGVEPAAGGYMYSAGLSAADYPVLLLRYFNAKGWRRVALISSTDASGQAFDTLYDRAVKRPEFQHLQLVAHEHFNVTDLSVTAQMTRIKAAAPNVVIDWTPGIAFSTLLRASRDVGLDVPIAGGSGNMTYEQMSQNASLLPSVLLFPAATTVVSGAIGPGPIRDAQNAYVAAFKAAKLKSDFVASQAWDAPMIVVDAYRTLGPAMTSAQLQHYLQNLHDWVGIMGIYDFRDGSQRGIGTNSGVVAAWDSAKKDFVVVSKPGGLPK
jgi:branched-chain amino acid transport system substrate-binding protein